MKKETRDTLLVFIIGLIVLSSFLFIILPKIKSSFITGEYFEIVIFVYKGMMILWFFLIPTAYVKEHRDLKGD